MAKNIAEHRDRKDSIGGSVTCVIRNCPVGLGEPVFDRLEAVLAHGMLSIPSTKGFEIGSGFGGMLPRTKSDATLQFLKGRSDPSELIRIRNTGLHP